MKNSALVVIDLQNDITKNYREIIDKVNEAIDWAVEKKLMVIYIQHNNLSAGTRTFKPGTRGAELVPEMEVVSDHIFTKSKSNALTSEDFTDFIRENDITDFYVVGADAAACIKSTCFNMTKSGYTVHAEHISVLLGDAAYILCNGYAHSWGLRSVVYHRLDGVCLFLADNGILCVDGKTARIIPEDHRYGHRTRFDTFLRPAL